MILIQSISLGLPKNNNKLDSTASPTHNKKFKEKEDAEILFEKKRAQNKN